MVHVTPLGCSLPTPSSIYKSTTYSPQYKQQCPDRNMNSTQQNGHTSPHWEGNRSYMNDSDSSGSYRIPARALSITWGNDPRYWQWITLGEDETQFSEGAMLQQVNWIEVTGKINLLLFKKRVTTTYMIHYIVKFQVDAFGWHSAPIKFKVRVNGKEVFCHSMILESYRVKPDVWQELPGGEFSVPNSITGGNVEFGMFEVESDWWKGSMVLAGIKISPKTP
ncbi:hypothetical protein RJ639_028492 [Escallonia herrerae]|uniref:Uncharacterized protein n=1 Tax=Escallonia herrerae TaxID=1293975 RepID=A0AA88X797_9ASTE|nr:hypothetical protein RJ639_028492 [Escallonia herrerae]